MGRLSKFGLLVAFLITVGYIAMLSGVTSTIKPRKTPAPEGFVATAFQPLSTLQSTNDFTVVEVSQTIC